MGNEYVNIMYATMYSVWDIIILYIGCVNGNVLEM